jgi:hypothetical protein
MPHALQELQGLQFKVIDQEHVSADEEAGNWRLYQYYITKYA